MRKRSVAYTLLSMRPSIRTRWCGLLLALAFSAFASSVLAQSAPTWARGEQLLPINYDECMRRAKSGLGAEGYQIVGEGGAYITGQKEVHTGVIMCNVAPEGKVWANIVVASTARDGNVSVTERNKLQQWMDRSSAVTSGCGELRVLRATYGGQGKFSDVTQRLQSQVSGGRLNVTVTNDNMGGDPIYGVVKNLYIRYVCGGRDIEKTIGEGNTLSIP